MGRTIREMIKRTREKFWRGEVWKAKGSGAKEKEMKKKKIW